MNYLNNIFICSYRLYKKTEKGRDPRFTSCILICICINGILFMTTTLLIRALNIANSSISFLGNYPILIIVFVIVEIIVLFKYYSKGRIDTLNTIFIQKKIIERRIWGLLTILTLVIPIAVGAIEFNR